MKHWRLFVEILSVVAFAITLFQWRDAKQDAARAEASAAKTEEINRQLSAGLAELKRDLRELVGLGVKEERRVEALLTTAAGNIERKCRKQALFREVNVRVSALLKDQKVTLAERELLAVAKTYEEIPEFHEALAAVYRARNFDLLAEKQLALVKVNRFPSKYCG